MSFAPAAGCAIARRYAVPTEKPGTRLRIVRTCSAARAAPGAACLRWCPGMQVAGPRVDTHRATELAHTLRFPRRPVRDSGVVWRGRIVGTRRVALRSRRPRALWVSMADRARRSGRVLRRPSLVGNYGAGSARSPAPLDGFVPGGFSPCAATMARRGSTAIGLNIASAGWSWRSPPCVRVTSIATR
jgi:hypothetical protein